MIENSGGSRGSNPGIEKLEKTLMLGKIEGGRRRGQTDEMVGWHHQLNGREFR